MMIIIMPCVSGIMPGHVHFIIETIFGSKVRDKGLG